MINAVTVVSLPATEDRKFKYAIYLFNKSESDILNGASSVLYKGFDNFEDANTLAQTVAREREYDYINMR